MAYTLVVIDMQRCFSAFDAEPGVLQAIDAAKRLRNPIIMVRFGCLDLLRSIEGAVADYDLCQHTVKNHDDGSREVAKVMQLKKWPLPLRVCGVNTRDGLEALKNHGIQMVLG
jgi:nicotinamidase-related amidase